MLADLVESMKKAALEAVANSDPATIMYGKVVSINPLEIQVNVRLILQANQLVLTRNVTDYTTSIDGESKTVHNALQFGEEVILIRQAGGQEYIVLDRVG